MRSRHLISNINRSQNENMLPIREDTMLRKRIWSAWIVVKQTQLSIGKTGGSAMAVTHDRAPYWWIIELCDQINLHIDSRTYNMTG